MTLTVLLTPQFIAFSEEVGRIIWLRGLDSNQDNQIQSLVCCQLHHPGVVRKYAVKACGCAAPVYFALSLNAGAVKFSTRFA